MPPTSARAATALIALLIAPPLGAAGCAQQRDEHPEAEAQIDHDMSQSMGEGAHMTLTPARTPTSADSIRAAAVADTLRRAIAKYADVRVAEGDGFRRFAPRIKNQPVFHYTRFSWAVESAITFDPAKPTSLLYRREPDGSLRLIGAMYTAPGRASLDELDRRVPLSIAHWHRHTNLACLGWGSVPAGPNAGTGCRCSGSRARSRLGRPAMPSAAVSCRICLAGWSTPTCWRGTTPRPSGPHPTIARTRARGGSCLGERGSSRARSRES